MIKKIKISLLIITLVQIILLINMTPASSYQISQTNKIINETIIKKDLPEKTLNSGLKLLVGFFSIKQIGIVSAEEVEFNCCLETKEGELCKDFLKNKENNCKTDLISSSCDKIAICELGCCIDDDEGLCSTKSMRQDCEVNGGIWNNEENCAISECQNGCCVLGDESQFTNEKRCERLSGLYGFEKDFRQQIKNEISCLALGASAIKSACLSSDNRCEIKSEVQCLADKGKYYSGVLCSNPELNTSCKKQASIGCVDGKDEIYWFDSCGNSENIYSSDKERSWNNGKILTKTESCSSNSANINSEDCGNCNYLIGSKCSETKTGDKKVKDGNFICNDLKCTDENGRIRENGESWCVYDGFIGQGKDVVGSRHWKRMCIDGEIRIEPCADYRGQVCVQGEAENKEKNQNFSIAACVINEASICIKYNSEKENMTSKCESNNMCYLKKINVDEGFKFDVCLPQYPKGFDLSNEGGSDMENNLCGMASNKCTVMYAKEIDGWECVYNCACEEKRFSQQMNDFCTSLGDCGAKVNIIGEGTNNIVIKGAPKIKWQDYINYSIAILGQFAEPKNLSELLILHNSATKPGAYDPTDTSETEINEAINWGGTIVGGLGVAINAAYAVSVLSTDVGLGYGTYSVHNIMTSWSSIGYSSLGPLTEALGAAALVMTYAQILSYAFGFEGQAATIMLVSGAIVAVYALFTTLFPEIIGSCGPFAWICAIVLIIIAFLLEIFGIGDTEEVIVSFDCLPWEAPAGGENCANCNEDPLKPCSKYRCESLGQACKLLNEDSENPVCEKVLNDNKPPIISPGEIDYGYEFAEKNTFGAKVHINNGGCIPEFTMVHFNLKTDEPSQCKYGFKPTANYEAMENYPLDSNIYSLDHKFGIMMPSIGSLQATNTSLDLIKMFGDMNMYVRCQDYYGDVNVKEYTINFCIESGPDLTPAYIIKSSPRDKGFIKYGETNSSLSIFLNEPAECKYDKEDKEYGLMKESMSCKTNITQSNNFGWPCYTTLTGLTEETNTFYIKCKDQPWFKNTINESQRNINTNGYAYTIYKSKDELKIDYIKPSGEIEVGFEPVSIDFEVKTSGGALEGKSACYYNFDNSEKRNLFFETYSNIHNQNINRLMNGAYTVYIQCEDEAGNIAKDSTDINILVDKTPPQVSRAYKEGGQLILQTNEDAECYYTSEKCYFNEENATSMTVGYSLEHKTEWQSGLTYYIRCLDVWGNEPDGCTTKLLPDFFISLVLNKFINKNILK